MNHPDEKIYQNLGRSLWAENEQQEMPDVQTERVPKRFQEMGVEDWTFWLGDSKCLKL